jgi:hypothetical protein
MGSDPAKAAVSSQHRRGGTARRGLQLALAATDAVSLRIASPGEREDAARRRLLDRLHALHGLPEKIAQLMTLGEVSKPDTAALHRTPALPPLGVMRVREILRKQLGERACARIAQLAAIGLPASLGQVHRGALDDGTPVAVKVQYPAIRHSLETDLAAVGWLTQPFGRLRRDFSLDAYRAELREMLLAEVDYAVEAEALRRYAVRMDRWTKVETPRPIPGLCSPRVLTMSWVEGGPVETCRNWSQTDREQLSRSLLRFFLAGILHWGEIYADAHPGNFRFRRDAEGATLGIVDFGCVRTIDATAHAAICTLFQAATQDQLNEITGQDLLGLYEAIGFDRGALAPMKHVLCGITQLLLEPLTVPGPFDLAQWELGPRAAEALGPHRIAFRTAGPPALLAFIRAYYGLSRLLAALNAPLSWREVYAAIVPASTATPFPAGARIAPAEESSTRLRIRVVEAGHVKADVTMRGHCAARLGELIPDRVARRAIEQGIDVDRIARRASASQFCEQELFETHDGGKWVRVWLE